MHIKLPSTLTGGVDVGDADVDVGAGDADVDVGAGDADVDVGAGDADVDVGAGDADVETTPTVMVFLIAVVTGLVNGFGPPTYGAGIGVDGAAFEFVVAVAAVCALHAVTTSIPFDVAVKYTDSTLTSTDPEPDGVNESVFVNAGP